MTISPVSFCHKIAPTGARGDTFLSTSFLHYLVDRNFFLEKGDGYLFLVTKIVPPIRKHFFVLGGGGNINFFGWRAVFFGMGVSLLGNPQNFCRPLSLSKRLQPPPRQGVSIMDSDPRLQCPPMAPPTTGTRPDQKPTRHPTTGVPLEDVALAHHPTNKKGGLVGPLPTPQSGGGSPDHPHPPPTVPIEPCFGPLEDIVHHPASSTPPLESCHPRKHVRGISPTVCLTVFKHLRFATCRWGYGRSRGGGSGRIRAESFRTCGEGSGRSRPDPGGTVSQWDILLRTVGA